MNGRPDASPTAFMCRSCWPETAARRGTLMAESTFTEQKPPSIVSFEE
jgi:hypothetical protein